jgi:diguanylate cyclase (GGDEF)-like protein
MFVQDGDAAIYVQATIKDTFVPGDRILVKGTTHESFRPFVLSNDITFLRHGPLPPPIPSTFDELIRAQHDCMLVSVHARIRAADIVYSSDVPVTNLQMIADGGSIDAVVDNGDPAKLEGLLDADVEIVGPVSGNFDGKMQQTGILIHATSMADVKVLKRASTSVSSLPITPMDRVLTGYHVNVLSQRMRVHGAITYYQPGSAIVLQDGPRSLWIQTHTTDPLQIGDVADATGYPGLHDGFLTITNGEISDSHVKAAVTPQPADWRQLSSSLNVFDLVSIEGIVVTSVREAHQDEYVLLVAGQMFSAIYRHPPPIRLIQQAPPVMRQVPPGSRIRVTGICLLDDSNPFNAQVPFSILMRSPDDITVLANPSWMNTRNLAVIIGLLLVTLLALGTRGWFVERAANRKTAALGYIERRRSRILEDINGPRPLADIIELITELVSFTMHGAPCWCRIADGAQLGNVPPRLNGMQVVQTEIPAHAGPPLGTIFVALDAGAKSEANESAALDMAAGLAALAIETRRLYADLLRRSEFDLLTGVHNRFSLEKHLDMQIEHARRSAGIFGLVYIDLDGFKQINDRYGHKVGDIYLQQVTQRMKSQVRSVDALARLGGDEFAALVPMGRSRADIEDIAHRLEKCFDEPFSVEGHLWHGSASVGVAVYPQDGNTRDSLLNTADAAMYRSKNAKRALKKMLDVGPALVASAHPVG